MSNNTYQKYIHSNNGKYRVDISDGKDSNGTRKRIRKTFNTNQEAYDYVKKIFEEKEENSKKVEYRTFRAYSEDWMEKNKGGRAKTTVCGYINMLKNINSCKLGDTRLIDIEIEDIDGYIREISNKKDLKDITLKKHLVLIKQILKDVERGKNGIKGISNKVIESECWKKFKEVNSMNRNIEGEVYTKNEVIELVKKIKESERLETIEMPVMIAVYTGMRRGEILGLKWEDVNFVDRYIYVKNNRVRAGKETIEKDPKTQRSKRKIYIIEPLYELLKEKKAEYEEARKEPSYKDEGWVYCKKDGSAYSVDHVTKMFSKFLKKNGLRHIKFHGLRHTFATIAYQSQMSIEELSDILGHSSTLVTKCIYVDYSQVVHKDSMMLLENELPKAI